MGHALQHTLMDVLTRWRRMQGRPTLWLPGTDHAGIATQIVVEKQLAGEGLFRTELGREAFERRVWEWKEISGGTIQKQMRREGISVDWSRERFTMDAGLSRAVREVFTRLYDEGLIYRGAYIVNWCPHDQTSLSDLEAPKEEVKSHLWHIAYPIVGTAERIVVATTRPETMLGDTAVAVNPEDERYAHLSGAMVALPLTDREIPIVADAMVESEFGTGAVKVTPAHDPLDFQIAERHCLPRMLVIGPDGRMTESAGPRYAGLDRFEARKKVLKDLEEQGLLLKTEDYTHSVGHHDRCGTIIEPMISTQWFMNVKPLANLALEAVRGGKTRFVPPIPWTKVFEDWMENIQPWCISRQLWWGHRIPAWYCPDQHITVAMEPPTACATCGRDDLVQEEDVLDTWFSSALWPFSTLGWPEQTEDLATYFPTDDLMTAYEIIFLWVARMMMMGLRFMGQVPFSTVIITGIVRDSKGDKMSKFKGNVIDPLDLFDRFGTDAVRFALTAMTVGSNDMKLQESGMESARNFANKIWNAARFVLMNITEAKSLPEVNSSNAGALADRWIAAELRATIKQVSSALTEYRFHEVARILYHFFWDDFCDWYIELSKPLVASKEESPEVLEARSRIAGILETSLRLLHPLMPFITEDIWQRLPHKGESIVVSDFPSADSDEGQARSDREAQEQMQILIALITKVRNIRSEMNIPSNKRIRLHLATAEPVSLQIIEQNRNHIERLARVEAIVLSEAPARVDSAARDVVAGIEIAVPLEGIIDAEKERERLSKELIRKEAEAQGLASRLNNPSFVERAPEEVVFQSRNRLDELISEIEKLRATLKSLGGQK
jgi:valyl-tRNA synthetase